MRETPANWATCFRVIAMLFLALSVESVSNFQLDSILNSKEGLGEKSKPNRQNIDFHVSPSEKYCGITDENVRKA